MFSCFIWYLISKDKSILSFFYYSIIISFSILVIDGYYQFFFKENIFGLRLISNRVSSLFGNELILGSYLSRIFPLLFALFLIKKRKKKIEVYFLGLLFILVDILIFLSGERAAFLFLNLSTVFIIILIKEYQKFRLYTFLLGVIFIIILGNSYKAQFERMFKAPFKEMGIIEDIKYEAEGLIIFTPTHDSHIRTAFKMFKDKPIGKLYTIASQLVKKLPFGENGQTEINIPASKHT